MKDTKDIIALLALALLLSGVIVLGHNKQCADNGQSAADAQLRRAVVTASDTVWFHNGEVLYPDMVHSDTLIVINARFLNEEMILNTNGAVDGSDGSINDLLGEGCVTIADYTDYIRTVNINR